MSNRRLSLPVVLTSQADEHEDVNLESLDAFLEEILDIYNYGIELIKILKQKYKKISTPQKPINIKEKIEELKKQNNLMIDEIFDMSDEEYATSLLSTSCD